MGQFAAVTTIVTLGVIYLKLFDRGFVNNSKFRCAVNALDSMPTR